MAKDGAYILRDLYYLALADDQIHEKERQAEQTPDANEQYINVFTFRYRTQGMSVLLNEHEPLLQVAIQCPYSGGPAVYRARALLSLLNDTIEYHDKEVCETMGIYRLNQVKDVKATQELKIIPNPTNGNVMLVFAGLKGNEIELEVHDVLGRNVFNKTVDNLTGLYQLSLSDLKNGLYFLKLFDGNGNQLTDKLIINK